MNGEMMTSMTNREMAGILFNIATLLRRAGNTNPYRTAAYERGARALMGYPDEAAQVLETERRIPFRQRQHIGKKLQAKIREMVNTGALDQYAQMLADLPPHLAGLMTISGIGPKTAEQIHQALGISTEAELVAAARTGRLRQVRGFGVKRTAAIATLPVRLSGTTLRSAQMQMSLFDLPRAA